MELKVDAENLSEVTKTFMMMPGLFTRARKSALKVVGYQTMSELRNHVEYGGTGWPDLHPLTRNFRKKAGGKWSKRRTGKNSPLFGLGKFARYRVDDEGTVVQVDFGKSKKGKPGQMDPGLSRIARKAETGETVQVTDKMRKLWAATRLRRSKNARAGSDYHTLKSSTHVLKVPKRPIFTPVFNKVKPKIPSVFEDAFWKALDRYEKGK
ncbi:MAG: hypothetical protein KJ737_16615 [Proteobacteria bacterium]|nr:hypothetical protein [Pseudomonadota bacterium]